MDALFCMTSLIYAYAGDAVLDDDSSEPSLRTACVLSFVGMIASLMEMQMYEFIPLAVGFLPAYKPFKQNFGVLKPLYVASLWTLCLVIPTLHHGEPIDGWACCTTLGTVAAISNESDIADAPADKREGIMTLPVMYGAEAGRALTRGFLGVAVGSFLAHPTPAILLAGGLMRGKRAGRTRTSTGPRNTLGVGPVVPYCKTAMAREEPSL